MANNISSFILDRLDSPSGENDLITKFFLIFEQTTAKNFNTILSLVMIITSETGMEGL